MPDYTAKMPKQPHDVSQSTGFTCPPGQISPLYYDMLHTGDELHFSASMFARLNPLTTAALGDIEMHMDYFFVPLSVMYTPITSLFYQTDDLISSATDKESFSSFTSFPVFNANAQNGFFVDFDANVSVTPGTQNHVFDCVGKAIFRLWDFLDMNPYVLVDSTIRVGYPSFTPWFALAYQAIYNLHPGYRNTDREVRSFCYNIDKFYNSGVIDPGVVDNANDDSIFMLHYANKPKDYFNSVKVSPMGSAVSMLSDPGTVFNSVNTWLNNANFAVSNSVNDVVSFGSLSTQVRAASGLNSYIATSTGIRQLFMVDKLLRIIGRSEKNYESQFLAHFGIKIPHDDLHNITHIGHDTAVLSPAPIISSANTFDGTNGSALGEVGGQGSQMLRGKKYNFKAPFHGVFMCLAYFVPRTRYVAGFNKLHQLNSITDFWNPEFDRKGMQPLFSYETNNKFAFNPTRLGWQFAYEQFKRKYDRIMTAFAPSQSDTNVNTYTPWFVSQYPLRNIDITDTYVAKSGVAPYDLKVAPTTLNNIMQVPYSPDWSSSFLTSPWLIYHTDPLLCDFNMYCKKVNGMSEYGEPEL